LNKDYQLSPEASRKTHRDNPEFIMPHAEDQEFLVPDKPMCDPDPIRIIHVGMGASGLLAAHKARKFLKNYELVCYEKNETIGGTWWENRYPGCACDVG